MLKLEDAISIICLTLPAVTARSCFSHLITSSQKSRTTSYSSLDFSGKCWINNWWPGFLTHSKGERPVPLTLKMQAPGTGQYSHLLCKGQQRDWHCLTSTTCQTPRQERHISAFFWFLRLTDREIKFHAFFRCKFKEKSPHSNKVLTVSNSKLTPRTLSATSCCNPSLLPFAAHRHENVYPNSWPTMVPVGFYAAHHHLMFSQQQAVPFSKHWVWLGQ